MSEKEEAILSENKYLEFIKVKPDVLLMAALPPFLAMLVISQLLTVCMEQFPSCLEQLAHFSFEFAWCQLRIFLLVFLAVKDSSEYYLVKSIVLSLKRRNS